MAEGGAGGDADAAGEEVSLLAGHMQVDVAATNLQPVPLGLLKARRPICGSKKGMLAESRPVAPYHMPPQLLTGLLPRRV